MTKYRIAWRAGYGDWGRGNELYDTYEAARAEAKRLNREDPTMTRWAECVPATEEPTWKN